MKESKKETHPSVSYAKRRQHVKRYDPQYTGLWCVKERPRWKMRNEGSSWSSKLKEKGHANERKRAVYAVAATTGAAVGAASTGLVASSVFVSGAAAAAAGASVAGFSKGATGAGSSILGGCSSTLAGVLTSAALGLALKKSPTRAERRRPTLAALASFFSSF